MRFVEIFGARLSAQTFEEAIERFLSEVASREKFRVHFCTVHSLVESTENAALASAFASAAMVCTDGMPLVWVAGRRGMRRVDRVAGPDVMLALCDRGRTVGLRHYFLGGSEGTPEALAAGLTARFPGLNVAGLDSPPFGTVTEEQDARVVSLINAAKPDVLWVGLGSPKQDMWAADHEDRVEAPLILAVGAAFDYHSGRLRRAPRWMRRIGLEWLFRLAMEPRRLWRRYLTTNTRFVWLLLREELSRNRSGTT